MITFSDGPAAGRSLLLRRAPAYLRVTRHPLTGEFDGLDQPEDEPLAHEELTVYVLTMRPGSISVRGKGGAGGRYAVANYVLHPDPPPDATARENESWRAWCEAQWTHAKANSLEPATLFPQS